MRPSFGASTMRIFDLSLGEMLWARRTIFMALLAAAPVLLAAISYITSINGTAVLRINGERVGSAGLFAATIWIVYLKFIIPALGVFYGTSLIADEVEDKTITYLFTRPVPRRSIVMGKFIAYLLCVGSVVLPSVVMVFLLMVPFTDMATALGPLIRNLGVLALGLAAYGAVFLLAGVVLERPLVAGLAFAFGWEQLALVLPGYLKLFTISYYLEALLPRAMPENGVSLLQSVARDPPSTAESLLCLSCIVLGGLILAMRLVEHREYVLDQRPPAGETLWGRRPYNRTSGNATVKSR